MLTQNLTLFVVLLSGISPAHGDVSAGKALIQPAGSAMLTSLLSGVAQTQDEESAGITVPQRPTNAVLLTPRETNALKKNPARFSSLLAQCKTKLDYAAVPSEVFGPAPHYTPTGVNTSVSNDKQLAADAEVAYRAALCYQVSGDERYAVCAQHILDAWAKTLKKVTTLQGRASINFNLPSMILAATWVKGAAHWNNIPFDTFLNTIILPQSEASLSNNHGLWGVFMEATAGAYLGNHQLLTAAKSRWEAVMQESVASDGTMPQEMQRSSTSNWIGGPDKGIKGMAYTHYALYPASLAAQIFADQGQPVWDTRGGKRLQAAFDRVAAWTLHPETFPYYNSNNGQLIGVRNAAYFALLLKTYPNKDAEAVLKQGKVGMNGLLLLELFERDSGLDEHRG